jgi:hypothetical protein
VSSISGSVARYSFLVLIDKLGREVM